MTLTQSWYTRSRSVIRQTVEYTKTLWYHGKLLLEKLAICMSHKPCHQGMISHQLDVEVLFVNKGRLHRHGTCVWKVHFSRGLVTETQTVHSVNRTNNLLQEGDEPYSSISLTHLLFCIVYYIGESESYIWDWIILSFFGKRPKALPRTRCPSIRWGSGLNIAENRFTRTIIRVIL